MKKLLPFKIFLFAPALLLSSCGYGVKEVYQGIPYNSSNFVENYYNVWDSSINPYSSDKKIKETAETL